MEKIKIEVFVSTNRIGSEVSDIIEVEIEDGLTDQQIESDLEEAAKKWMFENIDWSFIKVDKDALDLLKEITI